MWIDTFELGDPDVVDAAGARGTLEEARLSGAFYGARVNIDLDPIGLDTRIFAVALFGEMDLDFSFPSGGGPRGGVNADIAYDATLYKIGIEADIWSHKCSSEHFGVSVSAYYWALELDPQDVDTNDMNFAGGGGSLNGFARWALSDSVSAEGRLNLHALYGEGFSFGVSADLGVNIRF